MIKDSFELAERITTLLDDKKAKDIVILKVKGITLVADYFVIVTGTSSTHVQALAEHLMYELKQENITSLHKEGLNEANWVLVDYDSVVVHIFQEETRNFYNLERLWGEAEEIKIN